jgi:crossover junction endodeoxyribonuclease RuvC
VRIFGIDPGSVRTGYGCVDSDGSRHRLVLCGAITAPARLSFPERLHTIHTALCALLADCRPDSVAVESLFHAVHARSALQLGHARGVALLAATQAGLAITEYAPAEIKRAVVGYGRAEKPQVQQMVRLLLGLDEVPGPYDVSDALAVAICHIHCTGVGTAIAAVLATEQEATSRRATACRAAPSSAGGAGARGTAAPSAAPNRGRSWRKFKVDALAPKPGAGQ